MYRCRICGGPESERIGVREMMYGTRERFEYFVCSWCRCIQIAQIPQDLSVYYPSYYYSLAKSKETGRLKRGIRRRRLGNFLGKRGYFWGWVNRFSRHQPSWLWWARKANIDFGSRILDVGCGAGRLLVNMWNWGFQQLIGVEPHLDTELRFAGGVRILKGVVEDVEGVFDLVMFHHSFEHMPDPLSALRDTFRLLAPGGRVLIRIPVADSEAWRIYGADWVQFDAPRHLFLHTRSSIHSLADQAGFKVEEIVFDSSDFQFWGSELYRRDIPLHDPVLGKDVNLDHVFSREELRDFAERARELNEQGRGDQACFFLRKPESGMPTIP